MSTTADTAAPTDLVIADLPDIPNRDLDATVGYGCWCRISAESASVVELRGPAALVSGHPVARAA